VKKTKAFFCFVVAIFTIIILFLLVFFVRNQDGVKISGLRASKADAPYSVRINWNYDNKPLAVRGEYFEEAILAHAPSTIVLNPGHKFSYFKAKIGIDDGTQGRGAVRFGVYADGRLVFVSKVVRGGEPAMPVLVDIAKAKEVLLVVDGAAGMYVTAADICLIGADSVQFDGSAVNKVGSKLLGYAARDQDIPFYVLCDTSKFNVLNYLGASIELEEKTPDEVSEPLRNVAIKNPYFEIVPPELITGVITEEGFMEPLDIRQKMESMRKYVEPLYTAEK